MAKSIIVEGKTTQDAIEKGLKELKKHGWDKTNRRRKEKKFL